MTEQFSDAELIQFLDGTLPAETHMAIEAALATDRALADRLAALHVDTDAIGSAFNTLLEGAPPIDLDATQTAATESSSRLSKGNRAGLAASLAIAAVLGALMATLWPEASVERRTGERWHADVVTYHKLYVPETLTPLNADAEARKTQFKRVGRVLALAVPGSLGELAQVEFKRAQVLGFEGTPLAHLTYQSADGKPIALCFLKLPSAGNSVPSLSQQQGLSAVTWEQGGLGFIIVGDVDSSLLEALAKATGRAFPT